MPTAVITKKVTRVGLVLTFALVSGCSSLVGGESARQTISLETTLEPLPESTGIVITDQVGTVTLFVKGGRSYSEFWIESNSEVLAEGRGWSPVLATDGSVVYVDSEDLSLRRLFASGEVQALLPAGSSAGFLTISPDRMLLGFSIPMDLPPGSTEVGIYGAGIMELETGQVVVSRVQEGHFTHPNGWYGGRLLVSEWSSKKLVESENVYALDTNGDLSPFALNLPPASSAPDVSPDHQWMAYEDRDGNTILVNLGHTSFGTIPNVKSPRWTAQGLTGLVDGHQFLIEFTRR